MGRQRGRMVQDAQHGMWFVVDEVPHHADTRPATMLEVAQAERIRQLETALRDVLACIDVTDSQQATAKAKAKGTLQATLD